MASRTVVLPSGTKCAVCRHPLSFHPGSGPCKAAQCSAGCQHFKAPSQPSLMPKAPTAASLTEALDTLTVVIQRAPSTTRSKAAANLEWMIKNFPALRKAAGASNAPLLQILADCRRPPAAPQDAEVAHDDARNTEGPD